jgi:hypothetical protein
VVIRGGIDERTDQDVWSPRTIIRIRTNREEEDQLDCEENTIQVEEVRVHYE